MCPLKACKEKKGMCNCEKGMSVVAVLAIVAAAAMHFMRG
jgi:hypothetical protein